MAKVVVCKYCQYNFVCPPHSESKCPACGAYQPDNQVAVQKKERMTQVLEMISKDIEDDVKYYEGKEFNGRNVSEYFGRLAAQVDALAKIVKEIINDAK